MCSECNFIKHTHKKKKSLTHTHEAKHQEWSPQSQQDQEYILILNTATTSKKDGSLRTILNLEFLNKDCEKAHFIMESLRNALHMVRQGSYLASIDIKDAFYSVPISVSHRKYLKFSGGGTFSNLVPCQMDTVMQ